MKYFVYIVQCRDGSFYTGSTRNLSKRIWEHNFSAKGAKSIKGKRPVKLIFQEKYLTWSLALKREKEIKSWTRKKKENLVNSNKLNGIKRLRLNEVKRE